MAKVFLTNIDLALNELQNAKIQSLAADPTGSESRIYWNSVAHELRIYDGTTWVNLMGAGTLTLTGDVTGTGTGSVATTIANNAVTLAKMADMATASLLGRNTAGTGDPEVLSVSTARTLLLINNVDNTSDSSKPISTATQTALDLKVNTSLIGAASGIVPLNSSSKIDTTYLPAYVDDVLEYANFGSLPGTGTTGVIYVTLDNNYTYRWSGSAYVRVGASALTADEALKLTTPRNISMTGDVAWTVSFDGSGNVTAAGTIAANFPRKYAAAIAGTTTSEVITHNLGTKDVTVQLIRVASPYDHVEADIESTTTNTVTLRFGSAPTAGQYRVVVIG